MKLNWTSIKFKSQKIDKIKKRACHHWDEPFVQIKISQKKVQRTYLKTFFESIDPLGFALKSKGCSPNALPVGDGEGISLFTDGLDVRSGVVVGDICGNW